MPEVTVTVTHKVGLHARPASMFVQTSAKYSSDIEVTHGEITVVKDQIKGINTRLDRMNGNRQVFGQKPDN